MPRGWGLVPTEDEEMIRGAGMRGNGALENILTTISNYPNTIHVI